MENSVEYSVNKSKKREDLIGRKGHVTRRFKVVDASEVIVGGVKKVPVRIIDNMGDTYWTELDDDVTLD